MPFVPPVRAPRTLFALTLLTVSVALSTIFTAGCSGDATSNSSGSGAFGLGATASSSFAVATTSDLCKPLCTRTSSCNADVDQETCLAHCENKLEVDGKRADFVNGVVACWNTLDCREVLSSSGLSDCVEEAAAAIAPSDAAKSFCSDLEASLSKCEATLAKATCLDLTKIYADVTIEQARKCTEKSCANLLTCISATLGLNE